MADGAGGVDVTPSARETEGRRAGRGRSVESTPVTRTARRLLVRMLVANLAGGVAVFVYLTFVVPRVSGGTAAVDVHHRLAVASFFIYLVGILPVMVRLITRRLAPVDHWLASARPADDEVRRALLSQPFRQAADSFSMWCAAALVFGLVNGLVLGAPGLVTMRVVLGIVLGGLASCGAAYLLVEQQLRPLYARALVEAPPTNPFVLPIRSKMLVFWALGSGIPLLGIALAPLGIPRALRAQLVAPVVFLAVDGLLVGGYIIAVVARSVTTPLDEVRRAIDAVQHGNLAVAVAVDDGGEIGLLEAGFNHMVDGLRERQRLADLFGRHVGPEVAALALERGPSLGGEQRAVTALFVDLIGSTRLAQAMRAAQVVSVLNALFDAVVTTVMAEGGWVNKFEGDGALCVFGAPVDQEDHAARALRAARALASVLAERRRTIAELDAAIGVSSGTAVAGNVGALERFEYTVIGDPVNEASRLSELAKGEPGRLLVSGSAVAAAAGDAGGWRRIGEAVLRGRVAPTALYVAD